LLSIERLAARAGVHKVTIYRRWMSTAGLVAEVLAGLTPVETPVPDTGSLRDDLLAVARRVAATIAQPGVESMLRVVAGSTDERLADAARSYWDAVLDRAAEPVRLAQARGDADPDADPLVVVESLLAPLYLRLLVTRRPVDPATLVNAVDRVAKGVATAAGVRRR
jgi:AcrR family transcriptional regulator